MNGRVLALIGADGAGKSTHARRLVEQADARSAYVYLGSNPASATHMLPTTKLWIAFKRAARRTVHHPGPPEVRRRGRPSSPLRRFAAHLKSFLALFLKASEEVSRLRVARRYARQGRQVILDRHPWADYRMTYRSAGGGWLRWGDRLHRFLIERVYARPDLMILLDAPAETLHSRKREGSLDAVRARRREYLDMAEALPTDVELVVVDAARPADVVHEELRRIVWPSGIPGIPGAAGAAGAMVGPTKGDAVGAGAIPATREATS